MITAFQRSAFQDNAYQIGVTVGGGGGPRWGTLYYAQAWIDEQKRLKAEREKREREEALVEVLQVVEEVTAQAAPIYTDLSALIVVPPLEAMAAARGRSEGEELDAFMKFMLTLARDEEETH